MNTQELRDGNNLIDEFAPEITKACRMEYLASVRDTIELKYHSSWDWLMPIVNKIRNIKMKGSFMMTQRLRETLYWVEKETTWECVVAFIVWYNRTKTTT